MSDLTLTPDEPLDLPARPLRLVATGLADTAEVPRSPRRDPPPCYVPCEACGTAVLHGCTPPGERVALDTHRKAYLIDWDQGAPAPRLVESRAYPVHRCAPGAPA